VLGGFLTSGGSGAMLLRLMEDGRAVTYVENLNGGGQALAMKVLKPEEYRNGLISHRLPRK